MDLRRLRHGEWIAGISGLVLLLVMWLPWYGRELVCIAPPCKTLSFSAWDSFVAIDWLLLLVALVGVGLAALTATQRAAAAPVAAASLTVLIGGVATVVVLYRVAFPPDLSFFTFPPPEDTVRTFGLWLGLLACAGIAVGALLALRDERPGAGGGPSSEEGGDEIETLAAPAPDGSAAGASDQADASGPGGGSAAGALRFQRLSAGHWIAWFAALALLLVMAMDWYGTTRSEELRRAEERSEQTGGGPGRPRQNDVARNIEGQAAIAAEMRERNAWQAFDGGPGLLLLALLLGSAAVAFAAGLERAADRTVGLPLSLAALGALLGLAASVGVLLSFVWQPGIDATTTVHSGALLGLLALGTLVLGLGLAERGAQRGAQGNP